MEILPIAIKTDVKADLTQGVTRIVNTLADYLEIPLKIVNRAGKSGGMILAIADEKLEQKRLDIQQTAELNRANNITTLLQMKQEDNIKGIIGKAIVEGMQINNVDDKRQITDEWLGFFFENAKNISDEGLQSLWAKILAGEVAHPQSFSTRTFDVLKNLTQVEAQLFADLAQYSFSDGSGTFFLILEETHAKNDLYELNFSNRKALQEAGLIYTSETSIPIVGEQGGKVLGRIGLTFGSIEVEILSRGTGNSGFTSYLGTLTFTSVGGSLCRLVDHSRDVQILEKLLGRFRGPGIGIRYKLAESSNWIDLKKLDESNGTI